MQPWIGYQDPSRGMRFLPRAQGQRPNLARCATDPLLRWALSHQPAELAFQIDHQLQNPEITQTLLDSQVAEVAVRCELVISNLTHWPRDILNALFQADPSLDRSFLAKWSFDLDQIPLEIRSRLQEQTGFAARQDWETAAVHANQVCRIAPELAWGWEIAGYAAERRGDLQAAIAAYHQAVNCSVFTDQSVRLDTHWASHQAAKFSVARLIQLCPEQVAASTYLRLVSQADGRQRRREATAWWMEQAESCARDNKHGEAHSCYVAAAWDLGAEPISFYAELLDRITDSAERAGQGARAEVARTHRRCLRERYGV